MNICAESHWYINSRGYRIDMLGQKVIFKLHDIDVINRLLRHVQTYFTGTTTPAPYLFFLEIAVADKLRQCFCTLMRDIP